MSFVFGDEFLASTGHNTCLYVMSLSQDKNALTGVTECTLLLNIQAEGNLNSMWFYTNFIITDYF